MNKISKTMIILAIISIGSYSIIENKFLQDEVYIVSEKEGENMLTESNNQNNNNDIDGINNIEVLNNKVENKVITVFISGEVNNPNVVEVESGSRLIDTIDYVGGLTENADINRVNLAMNIEDGQHYVIPKIGEVLNDTADITINNDNIGSIGNTNMNSNNSKVNINTSTKEQLDTLPGVGEVTADKIIQYREENGNFKSIEEIRNVNGIGEKKYEDIRELITIN